MTKTLLVLVEGQTEEGFIKKILAPYYADRNLYITPTIVNKGQNHKGGIPKYEKVKKELLRLCKNEQAIVSTMFDLYGLSRDFPGLTDQNYVNQTIVEQKVCFLEEQFAKNISESNFIPYIMVYEFEALLFVNPEKFRIWTSPSTIKKLTEIKRKYASPELINDSLHTAPSKRIKKLIPQYQKVIQGISIAEEIGIDAMRQACPHFNSWLDQLDNLTI